MKPRKPKVTRKKATPEEAQSVTTPVPSLSNDIENAIVHAQFEYENTKQQVAKERKREFDALDIQIKEFMGPYMLIGYDLNGNPVQVVSVNSHSEQDAMVERVRRLYVTIGNNLASSKGTDPYGLNNNKED